MKTIVLEDYTNSFYQLLKETFEGPPPEMGSAFLEKGASLFQTLDQVTAEEASIPARPGGPTIAAHSEHVRFYIIALHKFMRGAKEKVDWKQSWLVQRVTSAEWEDLKERLHRAYTTITEYLQSLENWGDDEVGDGMAIIMHTAYHLGAIRQIKMTVSRKI